MESVSKPHRHETKKIKEHIHRHGPMEIEIGVERTIPIQRRVVTIENDDGHTTGVIVARVVNEEDTDRIATIEGVKLWVEKGNTQAVIVE